MTPEEAKIIIKIMCTADGGCRNCATNLITSFNEAFPECSCKLLKEDKSELGEFDYDLRFLQFPDGEIVDFRDIS